MTDSTSHNETQPAEDSTPQETSLPSLASEDITRLITENVRDYAIFATDAEGRVVSWNPGVQRLLGYSEKEIVGRYVSIIFMPEDVERGEPEREMRQAVKEGRAEDKRWHRRQDGTRFWANGLVMPLRDGAQKLRGFAKIMRDDTERKSADEELRDMRTRLEAALDAGEIGTWVFDVSRDRVIADKNLARFFSVSEQDAAGGSLDHYTRAIHPDDLPRVSALIADALKHKDDYEADYRIMQPNGSVRWVVARGRIERDAEGRPALMPGVVIDITARKQAENLLRASQSRLALAQQVGRAGTFEWDIKRDVNVWAPELEELYGVPAGTFGGDFQAWAERVVPEDVGAVEDLIRAAMQERRAEIDFEFRAVMPAGPRRWLAGRARFEYDREGQAERMIGINIDIHDRKTIEEEREQLLANAQQARQAAEDANRLKDEFLATLSHELRTPLTAILGWSRLLQTNKFDEAAAKRALETIERNALTQTQLIDDLLDVSRIITGKLRLDVRAVDLPSVVAAAVDTLRPAADAKEQRLQMLLDPLAGPISGDPDRLQQVVWNLVSNAIKFTPKRGHVQVRLERVNSRVEITVSDTGRGIEPEFLPIVFDRFRQADQSTTRAHGGLGLGLAIVRQLIELHGGTVRAESAGKDKGAAFVVSLPLLPMRTERAEDVPRAHPAVNTALPLDCPPSLDGLRVLVVDDEPDARELLAAVLTGCGARVATASSAAEALQLVEQGSCEVLVSDIGMPEEDGFSLIGKVRSLPPEQGGNTPALALTAYARAEERVRALRSGFQMHVPKPVEPAELITVIANLAGRIKPV